MADNNTEKQRVQELTDKLEQGLQDLFNSDKYTVVSSPFKLTNSATSFHEGSIMETTKGASVPILTYCWNWDMR